MIGVASFLVVLTLALVVTRVATVALRATGLSHATAQFQARSAFSGVGFTTVESEDIVNHPVRRQIVLSLMLLSSAGVISTLGTLLLSFAHTSGYAQPVLRMAALLVGVAALWAIASSSWVDGHLSRAIEWALARWTDLEVRDYVRLLHIRDDYSIAEIGVEPGEWLEGRLVYDLALAQEGVVVLGIRDAAGNYAGAPTTRTQIGAGDTVVVYGRAAALDELQARRAGTTGEHAHSRAVAEQRRIVARQHTMEHLREALPHVKHRQSRRLVP